MAKTRLPNKLNRCFYNANVSLIQKQRTKKPVADGVVGKSYAPQAMTSTDMAGLINLEKIDMKIPEQVPSNEQDLKSDAKQTITLSKLN